MGEDLSTGAKIGVILIILCSLIATVVALLTVVKNVTREGAIDLQSSLEAMDRMYEDNFNQKVVTGNEVLSALQLNQGTEVAIVVVKGFDANNTGTLYNYNAVLSCVKDTPTGMAVQVGTFDGSTIGTSKLCFDGKRQCYVAEYYRVGTAIQFNNNISKLYRNTEQEYINPNHKYEAKLIKDISGTTIGFLFEQQY